MRIVIAGGGTGGHIFPGLAIAQAAQRLQPETDVLFVGAEQGLERTVIPKAGYPIELLTISGLKNLTWRQKCRSLFAVPVAVAKSMLILHRYHADAVIGVGGYASGPVVLAAAMLGIPSAICEQNSIPGLTNRILGKVVRRVFGSFAYSASYFPARKFELSGNPVRQEFLKQITQAASLVTPTQQAYHLLVLGGSQGARALNEAVPKAAHLLKQKGLDVTVLHQAGKSEVDKVKQAYLEAGVPAQVSPFIDNMVEAYQQADVTICRSGATTCAEVMVLGVPTIMVPFPFAADDHQTKNAQELSENNAGILIVQSKLTPQALAEELTTLLQSPHKREAMAKAAKSLGRPEAAEAIAQAAFDGFR